MKQPDFEGPRGKMWKVLLPTTPQKPDYVATLGCWILSIPGAHPWWHGYMLSIISLADIPGVSPATKHYPEATHEIVVFALDPDVELPDPDNAKDFRPAFLTPANLVEQIHGVTDEQATGIAERLGRAFVDGIASPDTDYRSHTQQLLRNTVEHFTVGHPKKGGQ